MGEKSKDSDGDGHLTVELNPTDSSDDNPCCCDDEVHGGLSITCPIIPQSVILRSRYMPTTLPGTLSEQDTRKLDRSSQVS